MYPMRRLLYGDGPLNCSPGLRILKLGKVSHRRKKWCPGMKALLRRHRAFEFLPPIAAIADGAGGKARGWG
jgi:hypothetical protein